MSLSPEDRARILAEERARRDAREQLESEEQAERDAKRKSGCVGCLSVVGGLILMGMILSFLVGVFGGGTANVSSLPPSPADSEAAGRDQMLRALAKQQLRRAERLGFVVKYREDTTPAIWVDEKWERLTFDQKSGLAQSAAIVLDSDGSENDRSILIKDVYSNRTIYTYHDISGLREKR